jgi:hypothetical protein
MDEECLKSSNEQYALWTTDVLLHSSPTGTYCTVQYFIFCMKRNMKC